MKTNFGFVLRASVERKYLKSIQFQYFSKNLFTFVSNTFFDNVFSIQHYSISDHVFVSWSCGLILDENLAVSITQPRSYIFITLQ